MIDVFCVRTGDKYPVEYVHRLKSMVARHLRQPHQFICLSDEIIPGVACTRATLPGWWAKLELFQLRSPLIYYDLDVVLTADQQPLADWDGFGIIRDWNKINFTNSATDPTGQPDKIVTPMFNSSVMKLTGNEGRVWDEFKPQVMDRFRRGGDQRWITRCLPDAATFPPAWFASYKSSECSEGPPDGALAVIFHGYPKPHELGGWVADRWV